MTLTRDPEALLECASTIRGCGITPEILPVAEGSDGLRTAAQIRDWTPLPEEIILVQDDALSLARRRFGDVKIFPNVLAVSVGYRAFLHDARFTSVDFEWPHTPRSFEELTLEGAVTLLLAERWNVPGEPLLDSLGKTYKVVDGLWVTRVAIKENRCYASFGQRRWTWPWRVMEATKGGSSLRQSRRILGIASWRAVAMSWPDILPEAKTNSRTACCWRARFSSRL